MVNAIETPYAYNSSTIASTSSRIGLMSKHTSDLSEFLAENVYMHFVLFQLVEVEVVSTFTEASCQCTRESCYAVALDNSVCDP